MQLILLLTKKAIGQEKSEMITEAIFWYVIRALSGTVSVFITYMVLKYLNKKTLAMRTIFDDIIKEYIYLTILDYLFNIVMDIVVNFLIPVNNYVALLIMISHHTIMMAGFCQLIAILIIQYMYVFQHTLLNNEILVIFVTRLLVGCTAVTTTLMGDLEKLDDFRLITGKKKENNIFINSRPILIPIVIGLIVLITTEYKIYKFRKSVDSQQVQEEEERNCIHYCRKYSLRVLIGILSTFVLYMPFRHILYSMNFGPLENLELKRLTRISTKTLVLHNIIPFVLIVRNQKLFCFFQAQILAILRLCKLKKNEIKPIELNVL